MSEWEQWFNKRKLKEEMEGGSNPADNFNFSNTNDDVDTDDYEKTQQELFKVVFSKYPTETLQFMDGIAQRGDEEVNGLLSKIKKDHEPASEKPVRHPSDGDEVVPPNADTGGGGEFEE